MSLDKAIKDFTNALSAWADKERRLEREKTIRMCADVCYRPSFYGVELPTYNGEAYIIREQMVAERLEKKILSLLNRKTK